MAKKKTESIGTVMKGFKTFRNDGSGFYELNEGVLASGQPVEIEGKLIGREALVAKIRKMGP